MASTTQPDPQPTSEGQGGRLRVDGPAEAAQEPKTTRSRKGKAAAPAGGKTEGFKLYLTEDIRFRLRMLAFKRNKSYSDVANEVLDKALPRWKLERDE